MLPLKNIIFERKIGRFWEKYNIFLKFSHDFSQCNVIKISFVTVT